MKNQAEIPTNYQMLKKFILSAPNIAFLINKEQRLIATNQLFDQYFGTSFSFKTCWTSIFEHPNFLPNNLKSLKEGIAIKGQKLLFRKNDKKPFWGVLDASAFDDNSYIFYIRDINKEVHLKLNYSHAISQSPYGIIQFDQSLKITSINAAAEMLFRIYTEQLIGMSLLDLLVESHQQRFVQLIDRLNMDLGEAKNTDQLFFVRDGSKEFPAEIHVIKYRAQEETHYTLFVNDITTTQRQKEILAAKNEQLVKINQQLDAFLYSVYHDLRSPVSSIKGLLNLLQMPNQQENQQHYLQLIDLSADKLNLVLNNIVIVSQNSKDRLNPKEIKLESMLTKLQEEFKSPLKHANCFMDYSVDQQSDFYSDQIRIENILRQLIKNGIDFSDKKKPVRKINLDLKSDENQLVIKVIDNGIGISESEKEKVFDLFYRASEISKGSGLGLYIVKETVQKLNGQLSLESECGSGAQFTITIPNDVKGKLIHNKRRLKLE